MSDFDSIAAIAADATEWRRDLHRHPELGFDLPRTAAFVASKLRDFGCDSVTEGVGRSGVVALVHGRDGGRTVGLRADMDALPITETTGLPHASQTAGRMHACGHDGHTAMLLGAARHFSQTRDFPGTVALVFQPAEEGGGGGREMVKDGLMERFAIAEIYGMHNMPHLAPGRFAIRPGPFMASSDVFDITVTGVGAHAAKPNEGVDPVVVAAHIVTALQTIVARSVDPVLGAVVSVTSIESEHSYNVIGSQCRLRGTCRSLDAAVRDLLEARVTAVAEGVASALGASANVRYRRNYPVVVNEAAATRHCAQAASTVAGTEGVDADAPPLMGAEDFSFMLQARPGAFIFIGNGDSAGLHNPAYDFNDAIIPTGIAYWSRLARDRLAA